MDRRPSSACVAGFPREGSSIILSYRPDAAADVEELVRRGSECCAFLTFDVAKREGETILTVTAPPGAEAMLDDVFASLEEGAACGCAA